jgi:hypothetical protein
MMSIIPAMWTLAYGSMLCVACGCDLSDKSDDRRRLDSPKATKVVAVWKHLALQDDNYSESELDSLLLLSGRSEDQGKMCRKRFLAYQRLIEVADTLKNNQSKFFSVTMPKNDATLPLLSVLTTVLLLPYPQVVPCWD